MHRYQAVLKVFVNFSKCICHIFSSCARFEKYIRSTILCVVKFPYYVLIVRLISVDYSLCGKVSILCTYSRADAGNKNVYTIPCGKASILCAYYKALMQVSNCSHRYQVCNARRF